MAKNTGNNRIPVKWVRDKAKAAYEKQSTCHICGTDKDLELHHTHSITLLLNSWAARNNYDISTDEGILAVRDEFIEQHKKEIYDDVYTLCNKHHVALHAVYGKAPTLLSATKQGGWIEKQKAKYVDGYEAPKVTRSEISPFAEFY
jgi:5-methylcytosine-specific restriction endonuclease McrA